MLGSLLKSLFVTDDVEENLAKIEKEAGSYGFDAWGFNKEKAKLPYAVAKFFYDHYFRVKTNGLEHVPPSGRVLVIANHSGQLPIDGLLIGTAIANSPHGARAPRAMIERFFPTVPFLGTLLNEAGAVIGDPINCSNMLEREEAVIVFPEGIRGSGKPYDKRYQLQRFGNGFMHLCMAHKTPIVPVGVVGCEETMPSLGSIDLLAKMLGLPYLPIALPMVLPAKITLSFGEPMTFDTSFDHEEDITDRVELVKAKIRDLIEQGLSEREGIFL